MVPQFSLQLVGVGLYNTCVEKVVTLAGRHYTVSLALPGSIMTNAQSPELKTYLAGQVRGVILLLLRYPFRWYPFWLESKVQILAENNGHDHGLI